MTDDQRDEERREYYARTGDRLPRETLLFALEHFGAVTDPATGAVDAAIPAARRGRDS
jgi:hypothetical protein